MLVSDSWTDLPSAFTWASRFWQAQAGDQDALDRLVGQYEGLVYYVLRQQSSGPLSYAKVLQAGRIGLWQAIRGFDP